MVIARYRSLDHNLEGEFAPPSSQAATAQEHDPEKWNPVFGKDHAQTKNLALDPIQLNWIKG
jgi:hypothetical protein